MAVTKRLKQGFLRLTLAKKAILISSGVLMLSPLLPWWDNSNSFGVGEVYLGIQGPLFLVGALIMTFGAISFFNLFLPLLGKNFFKLRRKSGITAMMLGLQASFLLAIGNSVFFHPSFGTNISNKSTRFGMLMTFGALAVMLIAGYVTYRRELKMEDETEDIEDIMTNAEPVLVNPEPTFTPAARPISRPTPVDVSEAVPPSIPARANSPYSRPAGAYGGDPLQLDAKTRYKMMKSRERQSKNAEGNLWGGGAIDDNMKIRTDL
ncbi:hypothetical protein HOD30_04465 [Candidatus Peregrinibacteria bacterium]|jgi:hypothetical protein|nr:hypothetical protein [Candidatus Peregrinibacteria bacterium]MBT4632339.1 hypothetical protein [Candidatus Peregrinibacteria bacterium]MBT5517127.1 hypothetical protein [Candidatus Peregrinibacteria bacterium]MBT5824037.1 hypothetical protein [Candidatus Peregrinibacteria bacterium]